LINDFQHSITALDNCVQSIEAAIVRAVYGRMGLLDFALQALQDEVPTGDCTCGFIVCTAFFAGVLDDGES